MGNKIEISEEVIKTCRTLVQAAIKAGLTEFSASFKPSYNDNWTGSVSMAWEAGRHGSPGSEFKISLNTFVYATIKETVKSADEGAGNE